jgi:oxygen-independent coproporphyrinogen III oxidase
MIFSPDSGEEPGGIYIHIPFCYSKCHYCSFLSKAIADNPPPEYLAALHQQIENMASNPWVKKREFTSIFIGGGTPSVYKGEELAELIIHCLNSFSFSRNPEISLEVNPNSISLDKLTTLKQAGANRLSIGIQSFSDKILSAAGRVHNSKIGIESVKTARKAGFKNLNIDLIFAMPRQSLYLWKQTLKKAMELSPEHTSIYELMIEPDTMFWEKHQKKKLQLPEEEIIIEMLNINKDFCSSFGLEQYEISNFSKSGYSCRHNLNYWQNGSYLGLGAGAVSSFSGLRVNNISDPDKFITAVKNNIFPIAEAEALPLESRFRETVIMGMRLVSGVNLKMLEKRFGLTPLKYYDSIITDLLEQELVILTKTHLKLSSSGFKLANQILSRLV